MKEEIKVSKIPADLSGRGRKGLTEEEVRDRYKHLWLIVKNRPRAFDANRCWTFVCAT